LFGQRQKSIMIGVMGSTPLVGIKYDTRILKNVTNGFGATIGIGSIKIIDSDSNHSATLSIGPNYLVGKGTSHLLLGLSSTFAFSRSYPLDSPPKNSIKTRFIPEIGYRYSPREKGLTAEVTWNPLFSNLDNNRALIYFGIGIGYSFR